MRAVGGDEVQLDPALGPREPRLDQFCVMVPGIVEKQVDQPLARIHRLDRRQQHDRADRVDGDRLQHVRLTGLQVHRAVNVQTLPAAGPLHCDLGVFRSPTTHWPNLRVSLASAKLTETLDPVRRMHRIAEQHRFIIGEVVQQILIGLDEGRLLLRIQLARHGFRLAMLHAKPVQQRDQAGSALIHALWAQVAGADGTGCGAAIAAGRTVENPGEFQCAAVEGAEGEPAGESQADWASPRQSGLQGRGRALACDPDETVTAKQAACANCRAAFGEADQMLHGRYDKIDLPVVRALVVRSLVTRVERYAGHCCCCGGVTVAGVPAGLEDGSPFSTNIMALQEFRYARVPRRNAGLALYLRFTHAISYRRLTQLFLHLYGLRISEGAVDAMLQRARPCFDTKVTAILARLRTSRIVGSDETSVRINGRTHWNWVFQNAQVVIHVVRNSRAASVVSETMAGHRPSIWVSDLYGAQQGHADLWQVCLAHQLRDCKYAIEAGDTIFLPRMKALLLRAVVLAWRRKTLADSTRLGYRRGLDRDMNAIVGFAPTNPHGKRLRKRYGKVRNHLFTFLEHPEVPPDNNGSERNLRPTATYRKITGGFRSVVGTAA